MPIYTNALGSLPTQSFLLFKYLIPTLFSFFFLSFFHIIFSPPPSPLPSPVLSFCFVDFSFFSFLFSFFFCFSSYFPPPPIVFPLLFYLPPFYLVCRVSNQLPTITYYRQIIDQLSGIELRTRLQKKNGDSGRSTIINGKREVAACSELAKFFSLRSCRVPCALSGLGKPPTSGIQ